MPVSVVRGHCQEDFLLSVHDASGYAASFLGWRSEIAARLHDFLARKASTGSEKLAALVHSIENAVSTAGLKAALTDLCATLRREKVSAEVPDELEALFARIRREGRRDSIENYGAFLFTVETV
jgi:hypothetical protein